MTRILKAIGLMSGTSMDGIDAAILSTDGERIAAFGPALFKPYSPEMREHLRAALDTAASIRAAGPLPPDVARLERALTDTHADAVAALLAEANLKPGQIDVIGFHGQTLIHRPAQRMTLQILKAALACLRGAKLRISSAAFRAFQLALRSGILRLLWATSF